MRVAFCSAEVAPFAKTGGLGDVCGTLPLALEKIGVKLDVFIPGYGCIEREKFNIRKVNAHLSHTKLGQSVDVYFIESTAYFHRHGIYGDRHSEYHDNLERFHHFNIQVFEALKTLGHPADIIHAHDWHAALIPVYLKEKYQKDPFFKKTKSLLTIHNLAYQGHFHKEKFAWLGLKEDLFSSDVFEFHGKGNFLKAGIVYADRISTVSPRYAKEIQTKKFGCGLEAILKKRSRKLVGILNGIDYDTWDPAKDRFIAKTYGKGNYGHGKAVNKSVLQQRLGLPVKENTPLFASVGRLSHQKGVDLMIDVMKDLMKEDLQILIQGVGDHRYEEQLKALAQGHKDRLAVCVDFDEVLAHQVYAAGDFFLMPSTYEPCGLSQMIALNYGTVPVVFETGGLADTVVPVDKSFKTGNGIVFSQHSTKGFLKAVRRACELYKHKDKLEHAIANAFKSRFPWKDSAEAYKKTYQCLLSD
ncbi:MAG TPA: glycogen synthase GlgA [Candidatus Omnitrophota bacterium]|nr:glycogen synthase GlgA [Candidatus Omnitrophota bacterium]